MATQRPRGRRGVSGEARQHILDAARAEFAERGYTEVSMRGVARRAAVDPALVRYYYPGGKAELFAVTMARRDLDPVALVGRILDGDPHTLGERLVREIVLAWDADDGPAHFRALLSATVARDSPMVRDFLMTEIFGRLAASLPGPDARDRVALAATQLIGTVVARYALRVEPIVRLSPEELAARVGPAVQAHLAGTTVRGLAPPATAEHDSPHGENS